MSKTANITWALPTTRSDGTAQDPALLGGVQISFSADLGANFVVLGSVAAADVQQRIIPDLVDGDYIVRLIVFDPSGFGAPIDTPFSISVDTSLPGTVTNVVVSLT